MLEARLETGRISKPERQQSTRPQMLEEIRDRIWSSVVRLRSLTTLSF
jgi:hypothetical protein